MKLTELNAISPVDGRYRKVTENLSWYFSEGALINYRVFVEILGVENHCTRCQRPGQRFEIDHFNIGNLCGCMYWGLYHFMEILYSEGQVPWEGEEHIIHGICPDIFNQCSFRLIREKR